MGKMLKWSCGILAVSSALLLASCSVPADRVSTRLVDGEQVFTLCESISVDRVRVLTANKADFTSNLRVVWAVEGSAFFSAPKEIELGVVPDGMEVVTPAEGITVVNKIVQVYAEDLNDGGDIENSLFAQFDGDKISDEYWLWADGSRRDAPCD